MVAKELLAREDEDIEEGLSVELTDLKLSY
jgi:hypothetical protein